MVFPQPYPNNYKQRKKQKKEKIPVHCQNNWIPFKIFYFFNFNSLIFDLNSLIFIDKIYFTAQKAEEKIQPTIY